MEIFLIRALQLILALSILVLVHEFGHFLFAKVFHVRVDKFYLFFDWKFSLFKWKPKNSETEFGIGWVPLGGYCKIAGMIDESMDTEQLEQEPQEWEFRTKPAWQRLLVMFGGVLFNFIFAILMYSAILNIWGESYLPAEGNKIYANALAQDMGFRTGDEILRYDEYVPENFSLLQADLARQTPDKATVLRGKDTINIYIDHSMIGKVLNTPGMFDLAFPFKVGSVAEGNPNAGLDEYSVPLFDMFLFLKDLQQLQSGCLGEVGIHLVHDHVHQHLTNVLGLRQHVSCLTEQVLTLTAERFPQCHSELSLDGIVGLCE